MLDTILDLYGMKNAKPVATTGSVTIAKTVADTPLSPEEHSVYRTAVGKLLWLALIRGDIAYATKELSRDVTAPTMQSVAKLKHLLRYLNGTKMCVLRLRPSYQLSDGNCFSGCECVCGFQTGLDALRQGRAPVVPL